MEEEFLIIFNVLRDFVKAWWWVPLPFILYRSFEFLYLWWRQEVFDSKIERILLEIKPPIEVLKPLRAMEAVFSGLWHIYDPPNPREKWLEGKFLLTLSLEIVSIEGEIHFYIRVPKNLRNMVEASIYSQYPDVEISIVDDYIKNVPKTMPNKEWELWGCDYELMKNEIYPIKTYSSFFETSPEASKEEKRIDPLSPLLEGMSKLGPGEQLWVQIMAKPLVPSVDYDFPKLGRDAVNKLIKRPAESGKPSIMINKDDLIGATDLLVFGEKMEQKKSETREFIPPEMKLTPGEREIVTKIEEKVSKTSFMSNIRFIYLAKKESFFGAHKAWVMGFFDQFNTTHLNAMKPWKKTITKVHTVLTWFLDARRVYVRKRRLLRRYMGRDTPLFPESGGTYVLNIEELATLYHFPGRTVSYAPGVKRVEAKKGKAPFSLPVE
ncbi:hypothetical protein KAR26_03410 [Candidatus Parcubacteria bacterium]|nr:hypothetical protein [Candidatus Parcubacteria bacterium]